LILRAMLLELLYDLAASLSDSVFLAAHLPKPIVM
jgi:hypothetical protein